MRFLTTVVTWLGGGAKSLGGPGWGFLQSHSGLWPKFVPASGQSFRSIQPWAKVGNIGSAEDWNLQRECGIATVWTVADIGLSGWHYKPTMYMKPIDTNEIVEGDQR